MPASAALLVLSLGGCSTPDAPAERVLREVDRYLAIPVGERPPIDAQPFARTALSREEARLVGARFAAQLREDERGSDLQREYEAGAVELDGEILRFAVRRFGSKPEGGHSLFVSLHGGGAVPTTSNDEQWENQIERLGDATIGYRKVLREGVYVAPRAPTDTWDMWFRGRMHALLDRLIEAALLFEDVDPNRVYLLGYSAGGDGTFRLGARMADRFAGVEMAAGHPGDTDPANLRNVAFQLQGGRHDLAYDRFRQIPAFSARLDGLQSADPAGYVHQLVMWDTGHDFPDYDAVGWPAQQTRTPLPSRVVWRQDGTPTHHFHWLAAEEDAAPGALVTAEIAANRVAVESSGYSGLTIRLHDDLLDLDEEVVVTVDGQTRFRGRVERHAATLWRTLHERLDASYMFPAEIRLEDSPEH